MLTEALAIEVIKHLSAAHDIIDDADPDAEDDHLNFAAAGIEAAMQHVNLAVPE